MKTTLKMLILIVIVMNMFAISGCSTHLAGNYTERASVPRTWDINSMKDYLEINTSPKGCEVWINNEYVDTPSKYQTDKLPCKVRIVQNGVRAHEYYMDEYGGRKYSNTAYFNYEKKFHVTVHEPATIKIKVLKEGYKPESRIIKLTLQDPGFNEFIRLSELKVDTTGATDNFPTILPEPVGEMPARKILIVLDPIPGHATTTPWKDTGVTKPEEKVSFNLERLEMTPNGKHTTKVSGKITDATMYTLIEQEREKIHTDGSGQVRETKNIRRKISYIPKTVTLKNPFGPNPVFPTKKDGSFEGILQTAEEIFFTRPVERPYRIIKKKSGFVTYVCDSEEALRKEVSGNTAIIKSEDYPFPEMFVVLLDYDAAHKYALKDICDINLNIKDKISRSEVTPEITITAITAPTATALLSRYLKEFGKDNLGNQLSKETLSFLVKRGFLMKGQKLQKDAQVIHFAACLGAEYGIETVHSGYYYFKGSIKPAVTGSIYKTILLVERGSKVRTQQVKESEGGSMVDSN